MTERLTDEQLEHLAEHFGEGGIACSGLSVEPGTLFFYVHGRTLFQELLELRAFKARVEAEPIFQHEIAMSWALADMSDSDYEDIENG